MPISVLEIFNENAVYKLLPFDFDTVFELSGGLGGWTPKLFSQPPP